MSTGYGVVWSSQHPSLYKPRPPLFSGSIPHLHAPVSSGWAKLVPMNDPSQPGRENRRLQHRVQKLHEQLKDLADDNRELHHQMASVVDRLADASATPGDSAPFTLPNPAPAQGLVTRGVRKGLRWAAGAVRTLRRATDPGADMVRVLAAVTTPSPATVLPFLGDDIVLDLPEDVDAATVCAPDLPWLFALESIDVALFRVPGHETEILATRRDLYQRLRGKGRAGLVQAAADLQRPLIAKNLPCPSATLSKEWLLHPVHLGNDSTIWRTDSYLVGFPPGVRRAELQLNAMDAPVLPTEQADLLVLVSEPLVEGLEQRVAAGLEATKNLSRIIVSLAPWTEAGHRRLKALSSADTPLYDFGSVLNPATWETAVRSLLQSARPKTLWAIGSGRNLDSMIDQARKVVPSICVVGESTNGDDRPTNADTTITRTRNQHRRLEGTPGIGALHLAPTPLRRHSPQGEPEVRRTLGVPADATLVVVAGDLTPSSRGEDAAAVARQLSPNENVWFRVVGKGPLAPAIDDLGRLFGLERFSVSNTNHSLEDVVGVADVVCCPGRCEVLPPAAAIAVTTGVPVVAPASGETADLAEAGIGKVHLGGAVGDAEALARAVLEAIADKTPASRPSDSEIADRAERTGRIYRDTLTEGS